MMTRQSKNPKIKYCHDVGTLNHCSFSLHKSKHGDALHWSVYIQCKTSPMHWPTRAYLCYSCYFVTRPRPLQPDVQKHSSSLNTLHLLSHWPHHTANCIFGSASATGGAAAAFCSAGLTFDSTPPNQSHLSEAWGQFSFVGSIPADLLAS